MGLRVRHFEDIENILWAAQVAIQALTIVATGPDSSAEHQCGFDQGFRAVWQHMTFLVEDKNLARKIWTSDDIENLLQAARLGRQRIVPENHTVPAKYNRGFNQGFDAALWSVATSFGVNLFPSGLDHLSKVTLPAKPNPVLWFDEDIQNILRAIQIVIGALATSAKELTYPAAYAEGFEAALGQVTRLFGLNGLGWGQKITTQPTPPAWLQRKDIEHKLWIVYQSIPIESTLETDERQLAYWRGFKTGLYSIATSFGIKLLRVWP